MARYDFVQAPQSRVGVVEEPRQPRDVYVIPSWKPYAHKADKEAVLFSISDRPAQEMLGIWREQR